ncbi:MAG TPA: hypothetical protein VGB15_21030, partial [Longimicrobium sp.]
IASTSVASAVAIPEAVVVPISSSWLSDSLQVQLITTAASFHMESHASWRFREASRGLRGFS